MIQLTVDINTLTITKDDVSLVLKTEMFDLLPDKLAGVFLTSDDDDVYLTDDVYFKRYDESYYIHDSSEKTIMKLYHDEFVFIINNFRVGGSYSENLGVRVYVDHTLTIRDLIHNTCIKTMMCDGIHDLFMEIDKQMGVITTSGRIDYGTYIVRINIFYTDWNIEISSHDDVRITDSESAVYLHRQDIENIITMTA
jgi:hypothetical protein